MSSLDARIRRWRVYEPRKPVKILIESHPSEPLSSDTQSTYQNEDNELKPKLLPDYEINFEPITVLVCDRQLSLPRKFFERHSTLFRDVFAGPQVTAYRHSGVEWEKGLLLFKDVKWEDFRNFLIMLTRSAWENVPKFSKEQWISVLDLASKWEFQKLRDESIKSLNNHLAGGSELVKMGERFVVDDWRRRGYQILLTRRGPITADEAACLSTTILTNLLKAREALSKANGREEGYIERSLESRQAGKRRVPDADSERSSTTSRETETCCQSPVDSAPPSDVQGPIVLDDGTSIPDSVPASRDDDDSEERSTQF